MVQITIQCPAKINAGLFIYPRRADGFHALESIFLPISLKDTLTLTPAPEVSIENTGLPSPETPDNLIWKAWTEFHSSYASTRPVKFSLHKRTPSEAGLGGGSSDAAGALIALNQLHGEPYSRKELEIIGARIGSDVPFFIACKPAFVKGRGEILEPVEPLKHPLYLILCKPSCGISTKEAYQSLATQYRYCQNPYPLQQAVSALNNKEENIQSYLFNSFQNLLFDSNPVFHEIQSGLEKFHPNGITLSGSGSTMVALFHDKLKRDRAFARLDLPGSLYCAETIQTRP